MYYQTYMKNYYLKHKKKIKKQAEEWRKNNPGRVKVIRSRYKGKDELGYKDFREEKIKVLPFKERVSPETLVKMRENTLSNQGRIKYYQWPENFIPKKRILEGV